MDTSTATDILSNIKKEDNNKDSEDIVIDEDVPMKDDSATADADVKPKLEDATDKVKQEGDNIENTTAADIKKEVGEETPKEGNNEAKVKDEPTPDDAAATVKTEVKTEGAEDSEGLNESTASTTTEDGAAAVKSEEGVEDAGNKTLNLDSDQVQPTPVAMPKPKVSDYFFMFGRFPSLYPVF